MNLSIFKNILFVFVFETEQSERAQAVGGGGVRGAKGEGEDTPPSREPHVALDSRTSRS